MAPIGKFSGVSKTNFGKVDNVLAANIGGIDNINLILGGEFITAHLTYNFAEDRGWRSPWRPSNPIQNPNHAFNIATTIGAAALEDQVAWINGKPFPTGDGGDVVVNNEDVPTTWNSKTIADWSISYRNKNDKRTDAPGSGNDFQGATPSSRTGPGAGVIGTGAQSTYVPGTQLGANDLDPHPFFGTPQLNRFLFTEASGNPSGNAKSFVTRLIFGNAAGSGGFMDDPINNQLQIDFFLHARGVDMGTLQVWGAVGSSFLTLLNATDTTLSQSNENTLLAPSVGGITACGKLFERDLNDNPTTSADEPEAMDSDYESIQVNLNLLKEAERTNTDDHPNNFGLMYCIYFVHTDITNWSADAAIDRIRIIETT